MSVSLVCVQEVVVDDYVYCGWYDRSSTRPFTRLQNDASCQRYGKLLAHFVVGIQRKLQIAPIAHCHFDSLEAQDRYIGWILGHLCLKHLSDNAILEPVYRHVTTSVILTWNHLKLSSGRISPVLAMLVYNIRLVILLSFTHWLRSPEGQAASQYVHPLYVYESL